jgi:hypothetical protein
VTVGVELRTPRWTALLAETAAGGFLARLQPLPTGTTVRA